MIPAVSYMLRCACMSVRHSLVFLVALVVFALVISWFIGIFPQQSVSIETPMRELPPQAQLTQTRTVKAIGNKTFTALVSFSGTNFEPKTARVKAGDTVRFFNNSDQPMALSLDGAPASLPPGEYFEFTFAAAGTFSVTEQGSGVAVSVFVQ